MKARNFIDLIGPAAQASANVTGVTASFTVAEAALESGWGSSRLARQEKDLIADPADVELFKPSSDAGLVFLG